MSFPAPHLHFKPGYWFHNLIVFLDRLALIPAGGWVLFFLFAAGFLSLSWPRGQLMVFLFIAGPLVGEAVLLWRGQVSEKAPGPFGGPFFLYALGHLGASQLVLLLPCPFSCLLTAHAFTQTLLLAAMIYASRVEPFRVRFRQVYLSHAQSGCELKILLLSDLHLDRLSPRETAVLRFAHRFQPDLILIPGDLTNLSFVGDAETRESIRLALRELCRLAPVYLSRGTPEVEAQEWLLELAAGTEAVVLDDRWEEVEIRGVRLRLLGVPCEDDFLAREESLSRLVKEAGGEVPLVLLHHSPDLVESAARLGVSLYVAGHTHGGQICLPFFGPLYTASRYGRKYAGGTYQVGPTHLVVSRGLGLEGAGAPRLRFFCPPEVIGIRWLVPSP